MNSTAIGVSVTCRTVFSPKIETSGPIGMTANARKAPVAEITGARTNTTLSAAFGTMSSFSISLTPSASDCSEPCGPTRFGPTRCCIQDTARRSNRMLNSVMTMRNAKITTTLMSMIHHTSWPNCARCVPSESANTRF